MIKEMVKENLGEELEREYEKIDFYDNSYESYVKRINNKGEDIDDIIGVELYCSKEEFEKWLKCNCGVFSDEDQLIVNQLLITKETLYDNIDWKAADLKFKFYVKYNYFSITFEDNCMNFIVEAM